MARSRAVLSVDFEMFTHLPAYRKAEGTVEDPDIGVSVMDPLLEVLGDREVAATFFVVSEIAERHPEVLERAAEEDHEIGSHTHHHSLLSALDRDDRLAELADSRELLKRVTGSPVTGFRAPMFVTTDDHFELVGATGYEYDSSVVPSRRIPGFYGGESDRIRPSSARAFDASAPEAISELPVGVMPGVRLPLSGAWLRLFGVTYTIAGMRLLDRRGVVPVLYVHPWEFTDLPAVDGVPKRVYWRTGEWMWRALERILDQPFEFVTARSVVGDLVREDE